MEKVGPGASAHVLSRQAIVRVVMPSYIAAPLPQTDPESEN